MADLQGIKGIPTEPQLRKPSTYTDYLEGLKGRIFKESVMEPGFIESLTAPEGSPIDYQNISSTTGGRVREMFVDPMRRFGTAIDKGMTGKPLTIGDQLNLIEGMIDTTIGGLFQHSASKGFKNFDPNTLHMFVGPKAKDIVKAEKMAMRGASPAEIQSKLLMHKKPDGMWRKEISDVPMVAKEYIRTPNEVYQGLERDILTGRGEGMGDTLKNLEKYRDLSQPEIKGLLRKRQEGIKEALDRKDFDGVRDVMREYTGAQAMDIGMRDRTRGALNDYVKHPELFSQYPEFEHMGMTRRHELEGGYGGLYKHGDNFNSPSMQIKSGASRAEELPVYGHEIQHAVQGKEGWGMGGNPESILREQGKIEGRIKEINDDMTYYMGKVDEANERGTPGGAEYFKKQYDELMMERADLVEKVQSGPQDKFDAYEAYLNLLGEREARSTAERLGMSLEERRGSLPDVGEGATVLMR